MPLKARPPGRRKLDQSTQPESRNDVSPYIQKYAPHTSPISISDLLTKKGGPSGPFGALWDLGSENLSSNIPPSILLFVFSLYTFRPLEPRTSGDPRTSLVAWDLLWDRRYPQVASFSSAHRPSRRASEPLRRSGASSRGRSSR